MADPKPGEMVLFDYIRPPLLAGEYRMEVKTEVALKQPPSTTFEDTGLPAKDAYFNIEGPRFSLAPNEVAAVFPPPNGHGAFHGALPHVALGRRTLPWERALGDDYTAAPGETPYPWLALVLFEEGEYELKHNMSLEQVVPTAVFNRLGRPPNIKCDAVEAERDLLRAILPMPSELQLLTHVRQVNVDDRELSAGDSDGYFAVVMGNRLPRDGAKYRACLVSVEERTDLLPTTDVTTTTGHLPALGASPAASTGSLDTSAFADMTLFTGDGPILAETADALLSARIGPATAVSSAAAAVAASAAAAGRVGASPFIKPKSRLVLLHSWSFECVEGGTFRELMQRLDVGMIGEVASDKRLQVTDTGHIQVELVNRDGFSERAWFRGPLVAQPLSRDTNGPYHSADQARRVAADTGAEDISYACAFEVGRLLAAADARLAQELMRWRRGAYRQSLRVQSIARISKLVTLLSTVDLHRPVATLLAASALARVGHGCGPLADPLGLAVLNKTYLLRPEIVQQAFRLETLEQAQELLGLSGLVLDKPVAVQPVPEGGLQTLDQVLRDTLGATRLKDMRGRVIANVKSRLAVLGRTS